MADLIDRALLYEKIQPVDFLYGHDEDAPYSGMAVAACDVESAPAVDAVEVKYGEWVEDGDFLICLNCESEINIKNSLGVENRKNYCPNCGAKMNVRK